MRYEKRPDSVEALQWTGTNLAEVLAFTKDAMMTVSSREDHLVFTQPGIVGDLIAAPGSWVIKDIDKKVSVLGEDDFRLRYQVAREQW